MTMKTLAFFVMFFAASLGAQESVDLATIGRIKEEGLQRSRARALYQTLTDTIGARLTGSPAHLQAARWARDRFAEWKLANPRLEPFSFGRGWSLEKISVEMTAPRYMPLVAYGDAWTPSVNGVVTGRPVYVGNRTAPEIQAMAGRLRGAIVLTHLPQAQFLDTDRPQPGLSDRPIATGNPAIPPGAVTDCAPQKLPHRRHSASGRLRRYP